MSARQAGCTTNIVERLFEAVKKRSHKMNVAFRNEDSCLLMFYAVIRSLKFRWHKFCGNQSLEFRRLCVA